MSDRCATHDSVRETFSLLIALFVATAGCSANPDGQGTGSSDGGAASVGSGGVVSSAGGIGVGGTSAAGSAGGSRSGASGAAGSGVIGNGAGGAGSGGVRGTGGVGAGGVGAAGSSAGGMGAGGGAGASGTVLTGKLGTLGAVLPTVSSLYITESFPRPETLIYASSAPLTCNMLQTAGWLTSVPAGAQVINIVVPGAAAVMSYPVGGFGQGEVNYAPGGTNSANTQVAASSGTITFTQALANGPLEGTATGTYGNGDSVSGSFHAEFCTGGFEY